MIRNTRIRTDREGLLTIKPFEGSDLEVRINIDKRKGGNIRPFPHNMQLNNKHLLQEKNYHLFGGDAAIYLKDAEFINFSRLLFDIPYLEMGKPMIIIGYHIMNCNPHFTEEQLFDCLHHIAAYFIQIPDDIDWLNLHIYKIGDTAFIKENLERIKKAASQVYNTPFKGSIEKRNQVIFNPDYDLTPQEKREIGSKLQGRLKSDNTGEEIYLTLLNWNEVEKPTQKNIAKKLSKSERTIRNYWKEAKEKLSLAI